MLDLHRLRLLHEFSQRGTILAVAEALSYSASTVSQQLATLEREVGVPLLVPAGRRLQLTPEGRELAATAAEFLALEEKTMGGLGSGPSGRGPVRVAAFQSATHALVPQALTFLAASVPDLRVEIAELAPEQGLAGVAARSFDLAIAEQYPGHTREHHPGVERQSLGIDRIRLASSKKEGARDLASQRAAAWVMEPAGTAARAWAVQQCRAAGFEPDIRYEAADLLAHVRLIEAGHAVGLLPDLLWSDGAPPVHLAELPGLLHREIFIAARESSRDRSDIGIVRDALVRTWSLAPPVEMSARR